MLEALDGGARPGSPHPSIQEAALRAASTKGGGRLQRPPSFVDSFMDGCGEAGQVPPSSASNTPVECLCRVPPSGASSHNYPQPTFVVVDNYDLGVVDNYDFVDN